MSFYSNHAESQAQNIDLGRVLAALPSGTGEALALMRELDDEAAHRAVTMMPLGSRCALAALDAIQIDFSRGSIRILADGWALIRVCAENYAAVGSAAEAEAAEVLFHEVTALAGASAGERV